MSHNEVDSVESTVPTCWVEAESEAQRVLNYKNQNKDNSLKIKDILSLLKFEMLSLGLSLFGNNQDTSLYTCCVNTSIKHRPATRTHLM